MKLFDPKNKIWWLVILLFIIVILSQLFSNVKEKISNPVIEVNYSKLIKLIIYNSNYENYNIWWNDRNKDKWLHLRYIGLIDVNGNKIDYTATNTNGGANYGNTYPLDNLKDDNDTFYHSAGTNDQLTITLNSAADVKYIDIFNRKDCCQNRIENYSMQVNYGNYTRYIHFKDYKDRLTSSTYNYGVRFELDAPFPGNTGSKGGVGPQGSVGNQGRTGDSGVKGVQGDQGPQGDKGLLGNQGIQGDKGVKGVDGPEGDVGPAGVGSSVQTANETFTVMDNYSNIMNSLSTPAYL
jgi:hypothetical protein